jgi:hypothetical protein
VRKPNVERCVFCDGIATTRDHVPPKCMFPNPRPLNSVRVPACNACNGGTKLEDEYFRLVVASATSGSAEALALLKSKIGPKMQTRPALVRRLVKSTVPTDIHSPSGLYIGRRPAFHVDRKRLQIVINKIVRGLFYHETTSRLSLDARVADYMYNPQLVGGFRDAICSLKIQDIGDGRTFSYRYVVSEESPEVSFWFMMFYSQVLFLTQTQPASPGAAAAPRHFGIAT